MGYQVAFKAGEHLGHETRPDIESLRDAFFEYALTIKTQMENDATFKTDGLFSIRTAKFVGDYVNHTCLPIDQIDTVKDEDRVYLPTDDLAEAWKMPEPPIDEQK